jgi:hypothetical protein
LVMRPATSCRISSANLVLACKSVGPYFFNGRIEPVKKPRQEGCLVHFATMEKASEFRRLGYDME